MNDMIKEETNERRIEILRELKKYNKKAYLHMKQFGKTWKQKYREMWRKPFWKEAKELLREYKGSTCKICKEPFRKSFTLHHEEDFYKVINIFNPNVVQLVHSRCHTRHHQGGKGK